MDKVSLMLSLMLLLLLFPQLPHEMCQECRVGIIFTFM